MSIRKPKKLLNDPRDVPEEQLDGLIAACHGTMKRVDGFSAVVRDEIPDGKVVVLIGGGSGHEPMFAGYVGQGLADASALGEIFTSPSPDIIMAGVQAAERGKGVLFVYGNYAGDNMNFDIAAELLEEEGIPSRTIRVNDDIAIAKMGDRRGVAGDMMVLKIAGAAAEQMKSLDEVHRLAVKANDNTRSMGVALSACSLPLNDGFNFELADDELELGMGIHGEQGVRRQKMARADEIVAEIIERLCADLPFVAGDRVALLINNLGGSTVTELLIANRKANEMLTEKGIIIHDTLIGSYCTSQEMSGYSITLFKLDDELQALYDAPCHSFAWRK
ncbi:dihydroxyacetone kinase subunit DhaK [Leminorella grimontii]|uniref:Dihydroxyacetone kinase subunit DhaK n=1 Tax=Leminorella grimontii TaxID=82981 RepID=A0AAV5N499_9GAMM|nr:dihydroxyacetone kinase subunit DhaK [Leminorella grimontii]KFC94971.1 putative dihydroxyacetone-binding subunit of dihydroxyacetone kinase [Leminorella grimontii ATCC 33999 = DSM 5078]GKX56938.1 dihydroxyacetone kinase subunit DhaK [Leminorella grimontii]GKX60882.1 dihydroxyacetone kinase subunit DhaK [Leminorella grimontii]VFS61193.1 PTS-dependent dihydroxyacetone kinase, dihydroxyacetone-binding subunit dhaK [Leminorella grimontii]